MRGVDARTIAAGWDALVCETTVTLSTTVNMEAKIITCTPMANTCIRWKPEPFWPVNQNRVLKEYCT